MDTFHYPESLAIEHEAITVADWLEANVSADTHGMHSTGSLCADLELLGVRDGKALAKQDEAERDWQLHGAASLALFAADKPARSLTKAQRAKVTKQRHAYERGLPKDEPIDASIVVDADRNAPVYWGHDDADSIERIVPDEYETREIDGVLVQVEVTDVVQEGRRIVTNIVPAADWRSALDRDEAAPPERYATRHQRITGDKANKARLLFEAPDFADKVGVAFSIDLLITYLTDW